MPRIHLLHAPGHDRDAVGAYLSKAGYEVMPHDNLDELAVHRRSAPHEGPDVVIVQEIFLPAEVPGALPSPERVIVLGLRRNLPDDGGSVRLPDPCYLTDLKEEVARALEGGASRPRTAPASASAVDADLAAATTVAASDTGYLLRGLSHAFSNPLSAAAGWLQLLAVDLGESDPRFRPLRQVRTELHRLEKLIQALSFIGQRPGSLKAPLDLAPIVGDRVAELQREGLPVSFEVDAGPLPRVLGDPQAATMMAELLFGSFLEERSRVRHVSVVLRRAGSFVELRLHESGGTLPAALRIHDFGSMLRQVRYTRAFGIAMARAFALGQPGGEILLEAGGIDAHPTLVIRVPALAAPPENRA